MPPPCNHNPPQYTPGESAVVGRDCQLCWLYYNDDRYRRMWDGLEAKPAMNEPVRLVRHKTIEELETTATAARLTPTPATMRRRGVDPNKPRLSFGELQALASKRKH